MEISVRTLKNANFKYKINEDDTIVDVKKQIIQIQQQKKIFSFKNSKKILLGERYDLQGPSNWHNKQYHTNFRRKNNERRKNKRFIQTKIFLCDDEQKSIPIYY